MAALFNRWLFLVLIPGYLLSKREFPSQENQFPLQGVRRFHPFHVSVIEINRNVADKTLEISCKIFTDDFEKVLTKDYKTKVDLINPPNKAAMDSLIKKYLFSHLSIQINGKPVLLSYVGFENQSEAVYGYIEVNNISSVNKLEVATNIMYDIFDDQVNIMHLTTDGANRKSNKLNYPETNLIFNF